MTPEQKAAVCLLLSIVVLIQNRRKSMMQTRLLASGRD
jgi:hypothetical protein